MAKNTKFVQHGGKECTPFGVFQCLEVEGDRNVGLDASNIDHHRGRSEHEGEREGGHHRRCQRTRGGRGASTGEAALDGHRGRGGWEKRCCNGRDRCAGERVVSGDRSDTM